jgi:hypothetical protein
MNKKRIEIPLYLKRVNYFAGQLLTAADFQAEQRYFLERLRLHNMNCHGVGIVSGLEVSTSEGPARSIIVSPGTALGPLGNEINLVSAVRCPLPVKCELTYLVLYYAERDADPVPIHESDTGQSMASRVEEYAILQYQASESLAYSHIGIVLARLIKVRRQWKVDQEFQVRRARA